MGVSKVKSVLPPETFQPVRGADIVREAGKVGLDFQVLYEAVVDLSIQGLATANCINLAAGILLKDLGLPNYFFKRIQSSQLVSLLQSIASSLKVVDGEAKLLWEVAPVNFSYGQKDEEIRIATDQTRDAMEKLLSKHLTGHRREYYYNPKSRYYTYIIHSGSIGAMDPSEFKDSPFLFTQSDEKDEARDKRYRGFLDKHLNSSLPFVQAFHIPGSNETRFMFSSDFPTSQLPLFRKFLQDRGQVLRRAYWEPYLNDKGLATSLCSLYLEGELAKEEGETLVVDFKTIFALNLRPDLLDLYLNGTLRFEELAFAVNAMDFTHMFIYNEVGNLTDQSIMKNLRNKDHKEAFAKRVQDSNKAIYRDALVMELVKENPDLLQELYGIFAKRFDPRNKKPLSDRALVRKEKEFLQKLTLRFLDNPQGKDIFQFMFKIISATQKTNFFYPQKRSFAFRLNNSVLDPLVFEQFVFGIFYVNGHYAQGTHLRAGDIARGGLRLLRVNNSNHGMELDNAVLLNYALGPKAQRIKHKDICENGSKGVVVPHKAFAKCGADALKDYTEGILDLILLEEEHLVDHYKRTEMVFFGPDEGTAPMMDGVAYRAKERGYLHWRTLTTGKSFGVPHDTYGLLESGEVFGLFPTKEGVELQIEGRREVLSRDTEEIYRRIGGKIRISGMTTTSVMSSFRRMVDHYGDQEADLNLMITGGPDGDLGSNEIQCYKGKICLVLDGGSVLFDPDGLDKKVLSKLAFQRDSVPRINSLGYPGNKLGPRGFRVDLGSQNVTLPSGRLVADANLFHRNFLTDPENQSFLKEAHIQAFIPCGGFKDTINQWNVGTFLGNFPSLKYIVEGANVFFDDSARRYISEKSRIKQIKDTTANKGGVFSSSIAEVLTAFLLGDYYESELLGDSKNLWNLVRDVMELVRSYSEQEVTILLKLHEKTGTPLFMLTEQSSEAIFALQDRLVESIGDILAKESLVKAVLERYIPQGLLKTIGMASILRTLNKEELHSYRNSIITKKLSVLSYYKHGEHWGEFLKELDKDLLGVLEGVLRE